MLPKSSSVTILQQSKLEMGSKRVNRKESIFMRYLKGPIWVLARARDLYIQSLMGSGGHVSYGNTMGCPTPQIPSLPRSFSSSSFKSGDEELRDLIRLASTRGGRIEAELRRSKSSVPLGGGGGGCAPAVPRSHTVAGCGRIDENKAFEFGEDEDFGLLGKINPRNKIHAVSRVKVA